MNTAQPLKINGYKDKPVPNMLFKQDAETKHLAIIFPGAGYISRMPVLYYPTKLMLSKQADVLRVDYSYLNPEYEALDEKEQEAWFDSDVMASFEIAFRQRQYEKVTLIGKSLGTHDDHYNADRLEEVKSATEGTSLVVDGADHRLSS